MRMSTLAAATTPRADRPRRPRPAGTCWPPPSSCCWNAATPGRPGPRSPRPTAWSSRPSTGLRQHGRAVQGRGGGRRRRTRRTSADQRPVIQAVIAETDPRRQLELSAATQPGIHARSGPLLRVLAEAAATEPDLAGVSRQLETNGSPAWAASPNRSPTVAPSGPTSRCTRPATCCGRSTPTPSTTCSSYSADGPRTLPRLARRHLRPGAPTRQPTQLHLDGSFEHLTSRRPWALRRSAVRLAPPILPGHPMSPEPAKLF
jgi:hypothetical protein